MNLNKIEIDYFEDRPYKDEADKRSTQFREVGKVVNNTVDHVELLEKRLALANRNTALLAGAWFISVAIIIIFRI